MGLGVRAGWQRVALSGFAVIACGQCADAAEPEADGREQSISVSGDQLLDIGAQATRDGDLATAESVYRALLSDTRRSISSEARFRLAMLYAGQRRFAQAAVLLREVLDFEPRAQRVRLELARVLELMGDDAGARRALREAQAGGLPPEVARFVDRYSAALRAQKRVGASIDVALAPDSNINRATRSSTLGTVLGDFTLDEDAQERSGVGLAMRGQAYARLALGSKVNLFGRVSGSADLYRVGSFNDIAVSATMGPELRSGADRISLEAGGQWRWYGGPLYSSAATLTLNYAHPLGRTAQLRVTASTTAVDNRANDMQDGHTYSASLSYERALSSRFGVGATLSIERQSLNDHAYSTWAGQAAVFAYREVGPATVVATLSYGRLEADARVALFPAVRSDELFRASLGATFRNLRIGSFAPFIRATFERNRSSLEIYDYRKFRTEFGLNRAF